MEEKQAGNARELDHMEMSRDAYRQEELERSAED